MAITRDKVVKFASDFRTIVIGITLFFSTIAWGASAYFDTQYMKIADGGKITLRIKLDNLEDTIDDLTQELKYEQDPKKIQKLERTIEYKKNKVDALIKKHQLQSP